MITRPEPLLHQHPLWIPTLLKPIKGRTYGTPGAHLELALRAARRRLAVTMGAHAALIVGVLAALTLGIKWLYFSALHEDLAKFLQAAAVIAAGVAIHKLKTLERVRTVRGEIGRLSAGLRGERRVAELLERLPAECRIVHGVEITAPDEPPEDIDHVIVTPAGIWCVDAKNWSGDVRVDAVSVTHNDVDVTQQVVHGAARRTARLADYLGWGGPIPSIVCLTGSARARGKCGGVTFTDQNGLLGAVRVKVADYYNLHQDAVDELAEDIALLSPSATTQQPWRHTYRYLPPERLAAYRLRFLTPLIELVTFAAGAVAVAGAAVGAYNLFHLAMATGRELAYPTEAVAALAGGAALALALHAAGKALAVEPARYTPTLKAFRSQDRRERLLASLVTADGEPVNLPKRVDRGRAENDPDHARLERIFTRELVLPKDTLEELIGVQTILTDSERFKREWGLDLPYGILLHGPPGTGKTQIARTMAKAAGFAFYAASPSDMRSKWVGESAKMIHELYEEARRNAPAVVFIDEIDAVAGTRGAAHDGAGQEANHAVNQLLQEIDGLVKSEEPVFTIGATNLIDNLDEAVKSRLSYQILIDLPDESAREKMWRRFTSAFHDRLEVGFDELARASEGMSGRDIHQVVKLAAKFAHTGGGKVTRQILRRAFERTGHTFPPPTDANDAGGTDPRTD